MSNYGLVCQLPMLSKFEMRVEPQVCFPAGRLYKLDMSGYGLVCPFPVDEFAAFSDLESLDLSDNFDLTVSRQHRTASCSRNCGGFPIRVCRLQLPRIAGPV